MTHPDDIVVMDRGTEPPVLYDGCTVWASYWVEREDSTLEVFTGKEPYLAAGPSGTPLNSLPHRFPLTDIVDLLKSAGYKVTRP